YVNPLPTVSITPAAPTALLPGQNITLTANVSPGGGSYQWFFNGVAIPGANANTYGPLTVDNVGSYSVRYTDLNGCVSTSVAVAVTAQLTSNLYVYPNPNTGHFNVRFYNSANENATITVYNYLGAIMFQKKFT